MINNTNKWIVDGTTVTVNASNLLEVIEKLYSAESIAWCNTYKIYSAQEAINIIIGKLAKKVEYLESDGIRLTQTIQDQHSEIFELKKRVSALEQGAKVVKEKDYAISQPEARALLAAFDSITIVPYEAENGRYKISRVLYNLLKAAQYDDDILVELFGVCRAHTAGYGIKSTRLYTENNEYYFEYKTYNSCD